MIFGVDIYGYFFISLSSISFRYPPSHEDYRGFGSVFRRPCPATNSTRFATGSVIKPDSSPSSISSVDALSPTSSGVAITVGAIESILPGSSWASSSSQVLADDQSCAEAVDRWWKFRAGRGLGPVATETGGYCESRDRLPEDLTWELVRRTGPAHQKADNSWLYHGRPVKIADGSTVSMPDIQADQAAYP
jgi:hypothetical protein